MTFSDEGNNYYSFRIIIRINKYKRKEKKLVILVLGILANRHTRIET